MFARLILMPAPIPNSIQELTLAATERAVVRMPVADHSAPVMAGFWSVVLHAILVFNASVWTFYVPETIDAKLKFAKGESAQAVEVQLTLMMPPATTKPTLVKPTEDLPTPEEAPTPPVDERVEPQKPEPFEQTPPPAREPVDGAAPGRSPLANRVLEGDPADPAEPAPMEAPQEIERRPGAATADALKPVEQPREKPAQPTPSLAMANPVKTPAKTNTTPQAKPIEITMAAPAPTIEFTPPTFTLPTPPQPSAPTSEPASRAATAGVSSGAEAELVKPRYPALSIRAGEEGTIILEIEVLPDGSVGFVRIIDSPGYDRLEKAAIEAVKRSRFTPAQSEGIAIRQVLRKTIRFRLQDA